MNDSMIKVENIVAPADIDRAVATLTLAFSNDPVARWVYEDAHQYLAHFPAFVRAFGGEAFAAGTAYAVADGAAVALWFPPGRHADDAALGAVLEETLTPERYEALGAVFGQMGAYHPAEPHWYLPLIGIDTFHQNKGHGAMLMQHALRQCDRDHVAAYLESTNARNIPFYQRHGFEVLGSIAVDASYSVVPMLRAAR
jgi:ribosomal protein S18 acetylase RimI-like enzyme